MKHRWVRWAIQGAFVVAALTGQVDAVAIAALALMSINLGLVMLCMLMVTVALIIVDLADLGAEARKEVVGVLRHFRELPRMSLGRVIWRLALAGFLLAHGRFMEAVVWLVGLAICDLAGKLMQREEAKMREGGSW